MAEHYRQVFAKQWWIVAVCVVCVGVGSYLGSRFLSPTPSIYSASSMVEAQFLGTYSDTIGYMATEAKLCTSSSVLTGVAANYPGLTETTLASEITANTLTGTHLIQITVMDSSAARAAKLANDVANALIAEQQQATQQASSQAAQQIQNQLNSIQNQINQATNNLNQAIQSNNQADIANAKSQLSGLHEQQALLQFSLAQTQLSLTEGQPALSLAEQAQPTATPAHSLISSAAKYGVIGVLLGLVLGMVLVVVLDVMARRRAEVPVGQPTEVVVKS